MARVPWIAAAWLVRITLACWSGGLTPEVCCNPPGSGNPNCFDGQYTYERCCGSYGGAPKASEAVSALKVEPSSVPSLRLLDGGYMPMSGIGLCCRPTAQGDAVRQGVLDYLLMGGRHLDDAMLYNNHREVGQGVREAISHGVPRSEIFLVTKIWPSNFGFEKTTAAVEQILEELGLDYVDLVLLHKAWDNHDLPCKDAKSCRQESWLALQRARANGKVKHLGVSNFGARQMQELMALGGAPVTANQIEYHPWIPKLHRETADWCHRNGIVVTAYGSMGSSGLASQMVSQDALKQIGAQFGKTAGQVLLRWAVQKNVTVIPGTSNPKHMAENLRTSSFLMPKWQPWTAFQKISECCISVMSLTKTLDI